MAEACELCKKAVKDKYRLRDRFGKPTRLGTLNIKRIVALPSISTQPMCVCMPVLFVPGVMLVCCIC